MSIVGAAWKKKDKNGNPYISTALDEALLPLTIQNVWLCILLRKRKAKIHLISELSYIFQKKKKIKTNLYCNAKN